MTRKELTPVSNDPSPSAKKAEIERAISAYREATGLSVCVKLFHQRRPAELDAIAARLFLHETDFCRGVKRTRNDRCKDCDLRAVPERCATERRQFTHVCHAGANEVIIPLFSEETLAAVIYCGQFRVGDDQPSELPLVTPAELERIEGLSLLIEAYLGERLRAPRFVSESSRDYRAENIRLFLERNLRNNPSLADLARHLGLSATRTAHVVREATGRSFVNLRDELRLERATDLLSGTYHKVAHIATECGFSSPQYFHRFFRSHAHTTPLAFRRRKRAQA